MTDISDRVTYRQGNLLEAKEQYIAHQCNCVTFKGAHLSGQVFKAFPHADSYRLRRKTRARDIPGTVAVMGNGADSRLIINMFAQYYPGQSKYQADSPEKRQLWFSRCLNKIAQIPDLKSIAFPDHIGCGAAGGNWDIYLAMIRNFAQATQAEVVIYKFTDDPESHA